MNDLNIYELNDLPDSEWVEQIKLMIKDKNSSQKKWLNQETDALSVIKNLSQFMSEVVSGAFRKVVKNGDKGISLVAIGGFGRNEMSFHSDVDIMFLISEKSQSNDRNIANLLHLLWDVGLDIGHSSRTISEVKQIAKKDFKSCTAMMDSRLLFGDVELFSIYQRQLYSNLPKNLTKWLHEWRVQRIKNHASVQLLEPNIKESPGGLRDLQMFEWALQSMVKSTINPGHLINYLGKNDTEEIRRGKHFLWRIRLQMHAEMNRKRDTLDQEIKTKVSKALGYVDKVEELGVERFMQDYYSHARSIFQIIEMAFLKLTSKRRLVARSMYLENGLASLGGELLIAEGQDYFLKKPIRLLSVFITAQKKNLRFSEESIRSIRDSVHLIDDNFRSSNEARELFFDIIKYKTRVAKTIRSMHELGVLDAYIPEFSGLNCLVQFDIYHIYTVDEHTLVALENLESLNSGISHTNLSNIYSQFERKYLLFLAVMFHDIGKSRRDEHISRGVEITGDIIKRFDLDDEQSCLLVFLVRYHQEMVSISRRRDLDDDMMISEFAKDFDNLEWLDALYLISYADLSAVSPDVWTDWQAALLFELYSKTAAKLRSGFSIIEDEERARRALERHVKKVTGHWLENEILLLRDHIDKMPIRYAISNETKQIESHIKLIQEFNVDLSFTIAFNEYDEYTEIVVCTRDQRQLLAKICGILAVNDLNILKAEVNTRSDFIVLDSFQITDTDGRAVMEDWKKERVIARLNDVLGAGKKARKLLEHHRGNRSQQRRSHYIGKPKVELDNQVSRNYTVLDVRVQDDIGLLYRITHALAEARIDIHMAIIDTVAGRASDAFYVLDGRGQKIEDRESIKAVRNCVITALGLGRVDQST